MKSCVGVSDRKLLLILCGVMLALIVIVSVFAPQAAEDDPRPTITNDGPHGAKAAYLALQATGVKATQWSGSLRALRESMTDAQARRTTLILAAPAYDATEGTELAAEVRQFLERGGRVLATGPSGAALLPGGDVKPAGILHAGLCQTTPEGPGALARAGSVTMEESSQWSSDSLQYRVEQRCGVDAVVVRGTVEGPSGVQGEAIWWSSAGPLENAELKHDADLRLLLATIGHDRDVVFDESLHGATKTLWEQASGLPLGWVALQAALLGVLLVGSFGRRRGPVRAPVVLPRSSPLDFAMSMGDLYEKAAASRAATEAAERTLLRMLKHEAGLAQSTIEDGPEAIAEALRGRLGGEWSRVSEHLREAARAQHERIAMHSALSLVRALCEDVKDVRARLKPRSKENMEAG